jgi:hypothetical protein
MIDTLGWPTLAECRLKTRLIMMYKITHALIAIPNNILIPTDSRTRKSHNQTFRHITTQKDGSQILQLYSSFSLTSAWYARDFTSGFDICKFLFKYPRDLFPFEVILSMWVFHLRCSIWDPYTHDNINKLEMVQRQAARYVQNNYHNTSSVTSMIDTLGWQTLAECRLKTRLIDFISGFDIC